MSFGAAASAIEAHWPVYLIEGTLLGIFMFAATLAVVVMAHPGSAVARGVTHPVARRGIIGILMGLTAIGLIYSPWGQRSGAHMNPAVTLAFAWIGKLGGWDAGFYIASQCVGGVIGMGVTRLVLGQRVSHESVKWIVTEPGRWGVAGAVAGEAAISFGLFMVVLVCGDFEGLAPYTGLIAGGMVALFILVEAPMSGMSMNPARSLASAVHARSYRAFWVYVVVPPLAMVGAAGVHRGLMEAGAGRGATMSNPMSGKSEFRGERGGER